MVCHEDVFGNKYVSLVCTKGWKIKNKMSTELLFKKKWTFVTFPQLAWWSFTIHWCGMLHNATFTNTPAITLRFVSSERFEILVNSFHIWQTDWVKGHFTDLFNAGLPLRPNPLIHIELLHDILLSQHFHVVGQVFYGHLK